MAEQRPRPGPGLGHPRAAAERARIAHNEFTLSRLELYTLTDEPSKRSHERWFWLWSGTLQLLQRQDPRALERLFAKLDRHGLLDRHGQLFREVVLPVPPPTLLEAVRTFAHDIKPVALRGRRRRPIAPFDEFVGLSPTGYRGPQRDVWLAELYRAAYQWCAKQDTLNRWREKQGRRKPAPRLQGGPTRQDRAFALVARFADQSGYPYTEATIRRYVKVGRRALSARAWARIRWATYLTPKGELKK